MGNVGIGTATPGTKLDVVGTVKVGDGAELCNAAAHEGAIRYVAGTDKFQICRNSTTGWEDIGTTAGAETDPQVGTTTASNFCKANAGGTGIDCATATIASADITDASIATGDLANSAVTYAKMQNVSATSRLLGRATTGAGVVEELTIGSGLALTGTTLSATPAANTLDFAQLKDAMTLDAATTITGATGAGLTIAQSGTSAPLTVSNTGTGDSLRVEDSSSDTTPFVVDASGSVGVGTSNINSNVALQIDSTTKTFLPPRMTTAQRDAISSPPEGSVIYNTTEKRLEFFTGSDWSSITLNVVSSGVPYCGASL